MSQLVFVLLIALFGALVRTVVGFGEALVSMPLLALIGFDLPTATALIGALGLIVALPATIRYHQQINFQVVRRLVTGSLLGVPLGILLVKTVPTGWVLHGLGLFLMANGGYGLWQAFHQHRRQPHFQHNGWDYVAGLIAGALGSAYNSHGVPVALYGSFKQWPVSQLRGILQAHFLCVGLLVVGSQIAAGFWNMTVVKLLLVLLPLLVLTIGAGNWLFARLPREKLTHYLNGLFIIFGSLLLAR
ncbi:sulfite exporter TauE/SafE family protein [Loigolactobacillus bifermentans]|jgi:uncharacterized membrane protein YfcA|uniref:Probable membrane transporter protein n=1 Tax=Loigolactobacillus bifermentans DSM 20003 TaxID=1423726 RepID=A0A0R1GXQ9_9LACO|nr:sulfite exporter TauE/SafE family protein [Loigolactobacillus bifermentans]KRK35415.1 permease [Loigolactobacillus bifermentans DSM 20003]QGG60403.1 TSUP family transporter [Loigolactobacillus bifermentans]